MSNRRGGYTLNEMLIVLAVLAALAAMAWPSLRKPLAKHRLSSAAKQLRAELAGMRLKAIHRGQPLQFRYVPGTGEYRLEPLGSGQLATSARSGAAGAWQGGFSNAIDDFELEMTDTEAEPSRGEEKVEKGKLPEDIVFALREWAGESLAAGPPGSGADAGLLESFSGARGEHDWSAPIVFYPNGRTSDAEIALQGDRKYRIRLSLRGITGAVTVSAVEFPSEERDGHLDVHNPTATADARRPQDERSPPWSLRTATR